jgi:RNA polymerase-interacting CarD/CdnL/TRCF family regulator
MYGCESWSLSLREERTLKVSENRVMRIFEHKKEEVARSWRKLYDELHNLYSSLNIIRVIK